MQEGDIINLDRFVEQRESYTELRVQEFGFSSIRMVNGSVISNRSEKRAGACARARRRGKWGFACRPYTDDQSLSSLVVSAEESALEVASFSPGETAELPVHAGQVIRSSSPAPIRVENVPAFLEHIDAELVKRCDELSSRTLSFTGVKELCALATSQGSLRDTDIERTLFFVSLTTKHRGEQYSLMKKYSSHERISRFLGSPELFLSDLEDLYRDLLLKSRGVQPLPGMHTCILGPAVSGILAHEAVGHTVEADLVAAGSIAGDFMNRSVASPLVNLVDCAFEYGGASCPVPVFIDEEGIPAENAVLIENGVLRGFLHNRETAFRHSVKPAGNGRAQQYNQEPQIRMRNTAFEPGTDSLEEMISSIDHGYYLLDTSNGQADTTGEFMFAVNRGFEIENGRLGRAIKDTTVSGIAFDVLRTVTAVSRRMEWTNGNCGKKYGMPVGMGGPDLKCRVRIGG